MLPGALSGRHQNPISIPARRVYVFRPWNLTLVCDHVAGESPMRLGVRLGVSLCLCVSAVSHCLSAGRSG